MKTKVDKDEFFSKYVITLELSGHATVDSHSQGRENFHTSYSGIIYASDTDFGGDDVWEGDRFKIGRLSFSFLNLDDVPYENMDIALDNILAINGVWMEELLINFLDLETCEFHSEVKKRFKDKPHFRKNSNILIIDTIEIIDGFRGYSIGADMIQYLVKNFGYGCALFLTEAIPLQHDLKTSEDKDGWYTLMGYEKMSLIDLNKSQLKIKTFLKKCGFVCLDDDYMAMVPTLVV